MSMVTNTRILPRMKSERMMITQPHYVFLNFQGGEWQRIGCVTLAQTLREGAVELAGDRVLGGVQSNYT